MGSSSIVLIIVAILFPPAAVAFLSGCSCDLFINILLTILGYIPGHIHAFWLIYKRSKAEESYGPGGYRYIGSGKYQSVGGPAAQQGNPPPTYGATAPA
ncbi:hypothetical protein SCLCIDRAFT_1224267 [Scleroderma citrinum Foug A]|uniref:Stress response RCI peptide n=1 Tax=Scleroderma citrinum Foug A TaxID=1036808 RepID=A0A0C2ZFQ8_9AGAM|nr:hypothetical protein SCLCIDRAFT_1224267 [Scleroderma citrinum Foug A]